MLMVVGSEKAKGFLLFILLVAHYASWFLHVNPFTAVMVLLATFVNPVLRKDLIIS